MKVFWGVNWKNGMKLSNADLLNQKVHHDFKQSLSIGSSLSNYKYGLFDLPGFKGLEYQIYNNRFTIDHCLAVTRGGWVMMLNDDNKQKIESLDLTKIRKEFAVGDLATIYLRLHPGEFVDFGTIKDETFPAFYPNSSYRYSLEYLLSTNEVDQYNSNFVLPITQLNIAQDGIDIVDGYIPPLLKVTGSTKMLEHHSYFNQFNFELAKYTSQIAQKLVGKAHKNALSANIFQLSQQLAVFLSDQLDYFGIKYKEDSPLEIVLFYKKLSRMIFAALANMANREQTVNQMAEWTGSSVNDFTGILNNVSSGLQYDHLDINHSVIELKKFTELIRNLFKKISVTNI